MAYNLLKASRAPTCLFPMTPQKSRHFRKTWYVLALCYANCQCGIYVANLGKSANSTQTLGSL